MSFKLLYRNVAPVDSTVLSPFFVSYADITNVAVHGAVRSFQDTDHSTCARSAIAGEKYGCV